MLAYRRLPRWLRALLFVSSLGAVLWLWPLLWLWASYPQLLEQEPEYGVALLQAAPRALVQPIVPIEGANNVYLTRKVASFERLLAEQGWQLGEQMGTGATYQRGSEWARAGCRRLSRYFWACEVGEGLEFYQAP